MSELYGFRQVHRLVMMLLHPRLVPSDKYEYVVFEAHYNIKLIRQERNNLLAIT